MRFSRLLKLTLAVSFLFASHSATADTFKKKPRPTPAPQIQKPETPKPVVVRPLETVRELTILTYNVLNLKTSVGLHERMPDGNFQKKSEPQSKSGRQILGVVKAIKSANPDIAIFEEIEGVDTLASFNREYLDSQYTTHIMRGNDGRGIEIGFIVKKDLPLAISFETHRDVTWQDPILRRKTPLFSRDLPTLIIRRANQPTSPPVLIVMGNHAKSKRDRSGDFESRVWRTAQYEGMAEIIEDYQARFGPEVPLVLAGDFNTDVTGRKSSDKEVEPVRKMLVEAFDVVGLSHEERITHSFHPQGGNTIYAQVDAVFVSKILEPTITSAYVYRYTNDDGSVRPIPRSYDERAKNPSDHYPVVVKLKTSRIFPEAFGLPIPD
ncbi:MAG: endonuclease/exonuclease/phosphatase family protein [Bdellovibrionota bacterium]